MQILSSKTVARGTHSSAFMLPTFTFLHVSVCSIAVMPRLTSFVLRPNILSQADKFHVRRWRCLKSCWPPLIRNSRSNIMLNFGSKGTLKKLRNLSLSLSRRRWQLRSWLRGFDSLTPTPSCLRTLDHRPATTGQYSDTSANEDNSFRNHIR